MICETVWRCAAISERIGSGCKVVLLALWDHAFGWRPGDGEWFVWPSIDTLVSKLGIARSTVYRALCELRRSGWIREEIHDGHSGWWLSIMPLGSAVEPAIQHDEDQQLGFSWNDDRTSEAANAPVDIPVDSPVAPAAICPATATNLSSFGARPPSIEHKKNRPSACTTDDDASRIWSAYEALRVRRLGGKERQVRAPESLRALARHLGGDAAAWAKVEAYSVRSIELAAQAKAAGRLTWPKLVEWRSDGGEWLPKRYDATMAYQGPTVDGVKASAPPPPPPIVDGRAVDFYEAEVFAEGGAEAVRARRADTIAPEIIAALAGGFLAKLRLVGGA